MTSEEILPQLTRIIIEVAHCGPVPINRATRALDVRGWDSLTHTTILMQIEDHFGLRLPLERVLNLRNVGELADLIAELRHSA
ncbi:MAG: acyl carrier protein [Opitutae bacterium]|nr:acyl carrier protein [Opitutae bacterium]